MKKPEDDEDHCSSSRPKIPDLNLPAETSPESSQTMTETPAQRLASDHPSMKFVMVVKDTLQDRNDMYREFLNITKHLEPGRFDPPYVMRRFKELFKDHPQLILEYNSFAAKEFQIPLPPEDAPKSAKQLNLNDGGTFFRKVQETRHKRDHRNKNVQLKRNYAPMKECTAQQFYQGAEGIENSESDVHYRGTTHSRKVVVGQNIPLHSRDEDLERSIKELDLSNCKSCTPSYRILPDNYMLPSVSRRTSLGAEVLNDHCVLVVPGSKEFKHMQKNQNEKTIFLCEDERFKLDMKLELVNSIIAHIQELLGNISNNVINADHPFRIEDFLTARHLKYIQRLYGQHWVDVMDEMRKNAPLSLSDILSRLKQKQDELKKSLSSYNKVLAKTLAENFSKSLDHRSYNFKQQDSKSLSTSALVSEIKEIAEDAAAESIVARSRQPIVPHMTFEFPDPKIHEDLYCLIKYSCGKIYPSEQTDDLMKIWTTFLEPVSGVPRQPQGAGHVGNSTCNIVGERNLSSGSAAITKLSDGEGDGGQMSALPLNELVPLALREMDKSCLSFYGNVSFYVLFRLHQTLYERILKAKLCCSSAGNRSRGSNDTKPTDSYERLINVIYHFLDGSSDNAEFEDDCRSIIGTQSYLLCTLDELISRLVKQLRKIARNEADMRFIQLHAYEESRNPACFTDVIYSANAHSMLPDENIYRMEHVNRGSRLTIQLMDYRDYELIQNMIHGLNKPERNNNFKGNQFTAYLNNDLLSVVPEETETRGIYLKRNKKKNARGDESDAQDEVLEGVVIVNALEIKISPLTSKASYVMYTEDFMYRTKKRRETFYRNVSSNAHSAVGTLVKKRRRKLLADT